MMVALVHGSIAKIQELTGYSRATISGALHNNTRGRKAEQVRRLYDLYYGKKCLISEWSAGCNR